MLPYFEQPRLHLGPLTIHAFGALVATGVLVGTEVLKRRARKESLDMLLAVRMVTWVLVGGFIGAHLVDRLVYFPRQTLADPISIFKIWEGLSSFGGFLGAVTGTVLFVRKGLFGKKLWSYLDLVAYSFPVGWVFGRTGCFVAFDHPGSPTDFFLGQAAGPGLGPIHNLGLEEAIYTVFLILAMFVAGRSPRFPGFFVGLLAVLYAPVRFMLDFMRKVDVRYGGLTPGQWGSMIVVCVGIYILIRQSRRAKLVTAG